MRFNTREIRSCQIVFRHSTRTSENLRDKLKIALFFFDKMYLQSSGFCGYDKLQPKRTFTPHVSNHHPSVHDWNAQVPIHGQHSVRHGWDSSHAGRNRGRSRCCASTCLQSHSRKSSQYSAPGTSLIPVPTPCSRSSRMRCFDCTMTRSGRSETTSVSGKP